MWDALCISSASELPVSAPQVTPLRGLKKCVLGLKVRATVMVNYHVHFGIVFSCMSLCSSVVVNDVVRERRCECPLSNTMSSQLPLLSLDRVRLLRPKSLSNWPVSVA